MTEKYSNKQLETLEALSIAASTLSFIGGSFIILNYSLFSHLRTFAFKLILCVAIGDIINSIGNFFGTSQGNHYRCQTQAFLVQFGDITSFCWVSCIAWTINQIFSREQPPTPETASKWFTKFHIYVWSTALALTIIPISEFGGDGGGLCWISQRTTWGIAARMLCFYVPLWMVICYMGYVYCKVWDKITGTISEQPQGQKTGMYQQDSTQDVETNTHERNISESDVDLGKKQMSSDIFTSDENNNKSSSSKTNTNTKRSAGSTIQRMKYYPLILIGCYGIATIRRFIEAITGEQSPFILACFHITLTSLLGFFNGLVYGLTPSVQETDINAIKSCFCASKKNVSFREDDSKKHLTEVSPKMETMESDSDEDPELGTNQEGEVR